MRSTIKKIRQGNKKTLKNKINNYICKKKDICCEEFISRKKAIEDIFELYHKITEFYLEKDEYLSYLSNDLNLFIGIKSNLKLLKDFEGVRLGDEMEKKMMLNKQINETKITKLLNEVPLYYLLSFLGYAYYQHKRILSY
jgi:hypothetical protein